MTTDLEPPVGIVIIDDDMLVRAGLTLLLGGDPRITVLAQGSDGAEAVALVRTHRPGVLVMDLRMRGVDGVTATREVLRAVPEAKILVLTTFESDGSVMAALRAGALGFVLKDDAPTRLAQAILDVNAGAHAFSPSVASALVHRVTRSEDEHRKSQAALRDLTQRERDVVEALAMGLTNAEIATELHLSIPTVKGHVSSILSKTGLSTRLQLGLLVRPGP